MVSSVNQNSNNSDDGHSKRLLADGITPKQEKAILALLREPTIPKAAKAAGVGDRSIHRWLNEPAFSRAYRKARREAFGQAIALTQHYAPLAVNTLVKVMADENAPHHARVTASATLLKFGREGIELDDLAARIDELEQRVDGDEKNRNQR